MNEIFWKAVTEYGILGVLLAFFIRQNQKQVDAQRFETQQREKLLSDRIHDVEEYVKTELSTMVKDATEVMVRNTSVICENTKIMARLENIIEKQKDG